ncbi:hypothetical protein DE146DRAFT_707398 [Phaeosphaeria sp. MPI-PUGE-AT-0046c]|nr:hypothetical protein DE146DRAFT_707398 [Phaeosphaeria sp. MPI-PUGE-AT-0046c]
MPAQVSVVKLWYLPLLTSSRRTGYSEIKSAYERRHPRLSRPRSSLKSSYDVVIIGSGYGGGVAASRCTRAGKSVAVLERGAEKWPGEYPRTVNEAMHQHNISGQVLKKGEQAGKEAGLFQTVKGEGQDVFMACGLGGTSLINAGVFLRPDERILEGSNWPIEVRKGGLGAYFDRAKQMLSPTPYPSSYPTPIKLSTIEGQARRLGLQSSFHRPPVTTTFANKRNNAGVGMRASSASGNECTGTNDGSKNSVLATYLADAWARGAELFCGIDVKYLKKREDTGGYVIFFEMPAAIGSKRLSWVIANELVFMGAGAIHTPSILLRSRHHGLPSSPLLGQRISGNGDMLHFAYNCDNELNSIGHEPSNGCGPTITGCIDLSGSAHTSNDPRDGFIIQDGAVPEALAPLIQTLLETHASFGIPKTYREIRRTLARLKSWVVGPYARNGSVNRTMVLLTMSHDEDHGIVTLEDDQTFVRWEGPSSAGFRASRIKNLMQNMTRNLGGSLIISPKITVHPMGGAVMSADGTGLGGVVDHRCELFTGPGNETHKGLYCVDASVVPTSLGTNPCATIAALAERTCDLIATERGWQIDETSNGKLDLFGDPPLGNPKQSRRDQHTQPPVVRFDEIMQGFVHIGSDITNFETAQRVARIASSSARLDLRLAVRPDTHDGFLGISHGTFSCSALSSEPLLIVNGSVQFFVADENVSDARILAYRLDLMTTAGDTYKLLGHKIIDPSITLSVLRTWQATTTLYTTIDDSAGKVVGRGILHLTLRNFISEVRSLYSLNEFWPCLPFLCFFARQIASYFLAPLRSLQQSEPGTKGYYTKPAPLRMTITAKDGVTIPLKLWLPPSTVAAKSTPLLLVPGASVNEDLFSMPTIPVNSVDYFTSLGYKCYVPILRFGAGENARYGYTAFDARLDVRAAVEYVYRQEGTKVYVVAHCLGSIATAMALLTGEVNATLIAGMTVSQVFAHIMYSPDNAFKARRPRIISIYERLSSTPWYSISTSTPIHILDTLLRFYPVGARREICRSAVCHRSDIPFGRCWTHSNLNRATHLHLDRLFDGVHTHFLRHLSSMGAIAPYHVHSNYPDFADLVTSENLLKLEHIKMAFLYGAENVVWSSQATKTSYDTLRAVFPDGQYERIIVEGYGHMDGWIGKTACRDVWPRVRRHVGVCEETIQDDYVCVRMQRKSSH